MSHPNILTTYEEGLHGTYEEQQQTNQEEPPLNNTAKKPTPPINGKEKMPPMDRQIPDHLKLMRQKQAAEAKLLAEEQWQRSGVLKEHAEIREAKAAENAANAKRLKTPLAEDPNGDASNKDEQQPNPLTGLATYQATGDTALQGPTGTLTEDLGILQEKVTTPEGDFT